MDMKPVWKNYVENIYLNVHAKYSALAHWKVFIKVKVTSAQASESAFDEV